MHVSCFCKEPDQEDLLGEGADVCSLMSGIHVVKRLPHISRSLYIELKIEQPIQINVLIKENETLML